MSDSYWDLISLWPVLKPKVCMSDIEIFIIHWTGCSNRNFGTRNACCTNLFYQTHLSFCHVPSGQRSSGAIGRFHRFWEWLFFFWCTETSPRLLRMVQEAPITSTCPKLCLPIHSDPVVNFDPEASSMHDVNLHYASYLLKVAAVKKVQVKLAPDTHKGAVTKTAPAKQQQKRESWYVLTYPSNVKKIGSFSVL